MATRVALITGCSRADGLGFTVAEQLAELGFDVVLTARVLARAEHLAAHLRARGHHAAALHLDLTQPDGFTHCARHLTDAFGHLDVLINNATGGPDHTVLSALHADPDRIRAALEVDLIGPWALIQALLGLLRAAPAARIVNLSSRSARQFTGLDLGAPLRAPAFALAKYMLEVLTSTLARELRDTPILVNAVDPGHTANHPERGGDPGRPVAMSARGVVWAATLPDGGPTGGLFRDGHPVVV